MKGVRQRFSPGGTTFYPLIDGRLAQRLERSPHTREVKGSNPLSPTTAIVASFCNYPQSGNAALVLKRWPDCPVVQEPGSSAKSHPAILCRGTASCIVAACRRFFVRWSFSA